MDGAKLELCLLVRFSYYVECYPMQRGIIFLDWYMKRNVIWMLLPYGVLIGPELPTLL